MNHHARPTPHIGTVLGPTELDGAITDRFTPLRRDATRLRNTLRLNAATSLLGGLVAATLAGPLDRFLATDQQVVVRVVGIGLMVFASATAATAASRLRRLQRFAAVVIAADLTWVAGTIATIAANRYSTRGIVVVGLIAAQVTAFAWRQTVHLRRVRSHPGTLRDASNEAPPMEVARVKRLVDADAAAAWAVITDHELYGRLALNLSGVHAHTDNGPGLARTCNNRTGGSWSETCTFWEEGSRYDLAVDTTSYPYPLAVMQGSWSVTPHGSKTTVAMDFRFQPRPGVRGATMAALMHAAFPTVLRRILKGWEIALRRPHGR